MTALDVRYGRTRSNRRRQWVAGIVGGSVLAVALGLWAVWANLGDTSQLLESRTLATEQLSDHQIRVTFEVSAHAQQASDCAVIAVNDIRSPVGWEVIPVATDEQRTQVVTTVLNTSEPSVNAMVYRCWIP